MWSRTKRRNVRAQRKFAQGAYAPRHMAERRREVTRRDYSIADIIRNIRINMSATSLLDHVTFKNLFPDLQPIVVLERIPYNQVEVTPLKDTNKQSDYQNLERNNNTDNGTASIVTEENNGSPNRRRRMMRSKSQCSMRTRSRSALRNGKGKDKIKKKHVTFCDDFSIDDNRPLTFFTRDPSPRTGITNENNHNISLDDCNSPTQRSEYSNNSENILLVLDIDQHSDASSSIMKTMDQQYVDSKTTYIESKVNSTPFENPSDSAFRNSPQECLDVNPVSHEVTMTTVSNLCSSANYVSCKDVLSAPREELNRRCGHCETCETISYLLGIASLVQQPLSLSRGEETNDIYQFNDVEDENISVRDFNRVRPDRESALSTNCDTVSIYLDILPEQRTHVVQIMSDRKNDELLRARVVPKSQANMNNEVSLSSHRNLLQKLYLTLNDTTSRRVSEFQGASGQTSTEYLGRQRDENDWWFHNFNDGMHNILSNSNNTVISDPIIIDVDEEPISSTTQNTQDEEQINTSTGEIHESNDVVMFDLGDLEEKMKQDDDDSNQMAIIQSLTEATEAFARFENNDSSQELPHLSETEQHDTRQTEDVKQETEQSELQQNDTEPLIDGSLEVNQSEAEQTGAKQTQNEYFENENADSQVLIELTPQTHSENSIDKNIKRLRSFINNANKLQTKTKIKRKLPKRLRNKNVNINNMKRITRSKHATPLGKDNEVDKYSQSDSESGSSLDLSKSAKRVKKANTTKKPAKLSQRRSSRLKLKTKKTKESKNSSIRLGKRSQIQVDGFQSSSMGTSTPPVRQRSDPKLHRSVNHNRPQEKAINESLCQPSTSTGSSGNRNLVKKATVQRRKSELLSTKKIKERRQSMPTIVIEDSDSDLEELMRLPATTISEIMLGNRNKQSESNINLKLNKCNFPKGSSRAELVNGLVFYPTKAEFADPLAYFEKIMPTAKKFGLCKVVPPENFKPTCNINENMRFTVSNQYIARMFSRWGLAQREMCAIKINSAQQGVVFNRAPLMDCMEVNLLKLYQLVQRNGGLRQVIEKKRWTHISEDLRLNQCANPEKKLDCLYVKFILSYDMLNYEERQNLLREVERYWQKNYKKMLERALNPLHRQKKLLCESESSADEDEDVDRAIASALAEAEDCVAPGRQMNLTMFKKIAANMMHVHFPNKTQPSVDDVETEYWRIVLFATEHVCVNVASVDTGSQGYGFTKNKIDQYGKHPWNLKVVSNNPKNVLRSLGSVLGLTVPTLHLGMVFSCSCWHRDPHGLPWMEYMHSGPGKIWYGIPDEQSDNFRRAVEKLCPTSYQNKSIWLPSDIAMIPPNLLLEHKVSLSRVVQQPGEYIIVFPKAYSCSITTGYTQSESAYFATNSWLSSVNQVFQELRESCEPTAFSLEQFLVKVTKDPRVNLTVLQQVHGILTSVVQDELFYRKALADKGIAVLNGEIHKRRRKLQEWNSRHEECEVCRTTLYFSKVVGIIRKKSLVCLKHALPLMKVRGNQINLTQVQMILPYSDEELTSLITKVENRFVDTLPV